MKKAKIVLYVIAIFTGVGGSFAFKANRLLRPFYKTDASGICIVPTLTSYTTNQSEATGPATSNTSYNTYSHTGLCTPTILYPCL